MGQSALDELPPMVALAMALDEVSNRKARRKLFTYYPDTGPLRRELYRKHLKFFRLGKTIGTRCFLAANRVGKTEGGGGYELVLHLTGRYPAWWEGRMFDAPIRSWVAGDTSKTVRDIIQEKLLGPFGSFGTGLIPAEDIVRTTAKQGVSDAIDTVTVKHYDDKGNHDGNSRLVVKSYDQKRESFQGTEQEVIWLDEEADDDIRGECMLRLMTTNGLLIETFTPLKGLTPVVLQYLKNGIIPDDGISVIGEDKAIVMAGWDDVPHLTEKDKRRMLAETPPHLKDARSKGIPTLGSGKVFAVEEESLLVKPFQIPDFWPRIIGMDFGWDHPTAAANCVWDRDADCFYVTHTHRMREATPVIHAAAIKSWGAWIPVAWPHDGLQHDKGSGEQLAAQYKALGLKMCRERATFEDGSNGVEAGLMDMLQRMQTGRFKVFNTCVDFLEEFRMYHRKDGKVVKERDDILSSARYALMMKRKAICKQVTKTDEQEAWEPLDRTIGW